MVDEDLERFSHMWGQDKDCYLLSELDGEDMNAVRHVIIDMRTNAAVLIEDAALAAEVKHRMRAAGVRVGRSGDLEVRKAFIQSRRGGRRPGMREDA